MRISQSFQLGKTQHELDFTDIDPTGDIPLFLDPYFLSTRNDPWSIEATRTIRSFFQYLIELLSVGNLPEAQRIFTHLGEPNETCLGMSKGAPRGRGVGAENTSELLARIVESRAVETGIVEDIEDCIVFVDGIGKDKLSDMTTNIIKWHLIAYTQAQCKLWGIPLQVDVPSGFYWVRQNRDWHNTHTEMLVIDGKRILLVPKGIVSYSEGYTPDKYHQHFVLNFLQHEHLRLNSALVKRFIRRDGTERVYVTKKDIQEQEAPLTKAFLRGFTANHPQVFADFRENAKNYISSLTNDELSEHDIGQIVDYLIGQLEAIPAGTSDASRYHKLVVGILELIFYPNLICPQVEREIHFGRKRIDITFDNAANNGFFYRLHRIHQIACPYIFVECKNYSSDPANPELDQLAGRFSPNRGRFGLLLCRSIENMNLFLTRCADTYRDDRGGIIPLVDSDLIYLLNRVRQREPAEDEFLSDRLRAVILT
jgi:hypothetical protein